MEKTRKNMNEARELDKINQRKYRAKELLENPIEYIFSVAQNKVYSRNKGTKTETGRRHFFLIS